MANEFGQITTDERLAAREMHLQYAQFRRFVKHPLPGRGVEFGAGARQLERVRAIGAAQRAAMRQLGQQRQRRFNPRATHQSRCRGLTTECTVTLSPGGHERSTFLSTRSCSILTTSLAMISRGASYR